jgi:hypothetical protein
MLDGFPNKVGAVFGLAECGNDSLEGSRFESGLHVLGPKRRTTHARGRIAYHFIRQGRSVSHITY